MRTLSEKYLGGTKVEEDVYQVDLAVLDRYQSFSAELLRLSLLGIAGYGFLFSDVVFKALENNQPKYRDAFLASEWLLIVGALALGISAVAALGHRYHSTDCLTHFVRRIRLVKENGPDLKPEKRAEIEKIIVQEELSLKKDISMCKWSLLAASVLLAVGIVCVAIATSAILFPS